MQLCVCSAKHFYGCQKQKPEVLTAKVTHGEVLLQRGAEPFLLKLQGQLENAGSTEDHFRQFIEWSMGVPSQLSTIIDSAAFTPAKRRRWCFRNWQHRDYLKVRTAMA